MIRKHVSSSAIYSVGYDPFSCIMEIQFKGTMEVYRYWNVPQSVFDGLMRAGSKGAYYNRYIKDRYPYD